MAPAVALYHPSRTWQPLPRNTVWTVNVHAGENVPGSVRASRAESIISPRLVNRPCRVPAVAENPRAISTRISPAAAGIGTTSPVVAGGIGGSVTMAPAEAGSARSPSTIGTTLTRSPARGKGPDPFPDAMPNRPMSRRYHIRVGSPGAPAAVRAG